MLEDAACDALVLNHRYQPHRPSAPRADEHVHRVRPLQQDGPAQPSRRGRPGSSAATTASPRVRTGRKDTLKQPSALFTALRNSEKDAGVTSHVTPHRLRYAFNDLMRLAGIDQVTRRLMIGHVTEEMQEHYSTVLMEEKRTAMAAVATTMERVRQGARGDGGGYDRSHGPEKGEGRMR